ncbi:MAG: hypothetical protein ABW061_09345 [Polyangiaceae bacterium]
MQSVVWSLVLQLSHCSLQLWAQDLPQASLLPLNLPFDVASEVQLSVHSLTQTSWELLVLMVSHSFEHESVRVFSHLVVSVVVQLELHKVDVFGEHTL